MFDYLMGGTGLVLNTLFIYEIYMNFLYASILSGITLFYWHEKWFMSYLYCVITNNFFLGATIVYWMFCGMGLDRLANITALSMEFIWEFTYRIMSLFGEFDNFRTCVEFKCVNARYWFWFSVLNLFTDPGYLMGYLFAIIVCKWDLDIDPHFVLENIAEPFHQWFESKLTDFTGIDKFVCPYGTTGKNDKN